MKSYVTGNEGSHRGPRLIAERKPLRPVRIAPEPTPIRVTKPLPIRPVLQVR